MNGNAIFFIQVSFLKGMVLIYCIFMKRKCIIPNKDKVEPFNGLLCLQL